MGGIILFTFTEDHFELGRIWFDPAYQNQGIGKESMSCVFSFHPQAKKWTLGTPEWTVRNQHYYESIGFIRIGVTDVDPQLISRVMNTRS